MADTDNTQAQKRQPKLGPELLDAIIGKRINEGHTIATEDTPSAKILAGDAYGWVTGGFFVVRSAYGRAGNFDGGGIEIIGYDADSKNYRTHFFDTQGNTITEELTMDRRRPNTSEVP